MSHPLLDPHRPLLDRALEAIATRGYWSAYAESPSPKAYGEGAPEAGRAASRPTWASPSSSASQASAAGTTARLRPTVSP